MWLILGLDLVMDVGLCWGSVSVANLMITIVGACEAGISGGSSPGGGLGTRVRVTVRVEDRVEVEVGVRVRVRDRDRVRVRVRVRARVVRHVVQGWWEGPGRVRASKS